METRFNIGLRGQSSALVIALNESEERYKPSAVIYEALAILDFAIHEIAAGRQFGSFDRETGTMNQMVTPILRYVQRDPHWLADYMSMYPIDEKTSSRESTAAG